MTIASGAWASQLIIGRSRLIRPSTSRSRMTTKCHGCELPQLPLQRAIWSSWATTASSTGSPEYRRTCGTRSCSIAIRALTTRVSAPTFPRADAGGSGLRLAPALVADDLRQWLASPRTRHRPRVPARDRSADRDDRPRGLLRRDAQDLLRLGLLLLVTEPRRPAAVALHVRGDEQALRHATLVVGLAVAGALEHDGDRERRGREPVDVRSQLADRPERLGITHHDAVPRLAVLRAARPPRDLEQALQHIVRDRLRPVLAGLGEGAGALRSQAARHRGARRGPPTPRCAL